MGRDAPTLSYHPRQGREISKALLEPALGRRLQRGDRRGEARTVPLDDPERHQRRAERRPGDDPGPSRRPTTTSVSSGASTCSRRSTTEGGPRSASRRPRTSRGPPTRSPSSLVEGRDLLGAAKDGYVYRDKGNGRMALYKRDRGLELKIRSPFNRSPEARELAEIFNLTPGLNRYRIESELEPDAESSPPDALPGGRHALPQPPVDPPDHDLPVQGGLRPRRARPERRGAHDPRPRRPAVRLDEHHRRQLLRRLAEAPPARRRGRHPIPGLLVLHPPGRRRIPDPPWPSWRSSSRSRSRRTSRAARC